jgi:hypothetical protein
MNAFHPSCLALLRTQNLTCHHVRATQQIEAVEAALGHKKLANHTVLYIAIGAGALVLIGVLLFCLCKPSKKSANSVALMQNQAQYANMA